MGFGTEAKAAVRVLITTIGRNFRLLSSALHLDMKYLQSHLAAVRHRYDILQVFNQLINKFILFTAAGLKKMSITISNSNIRNDIKTLSH